MASGENTGDLDFYSQAFPAFVKAVEMGDVAGDLSLWASDFSHALKGVYYLEKKACC